MNQGKYDHSTSNLSDLVSELSQHGIQYSTDTSIRDAKANTKHSPVDPQHTPQIVFFPRSTQETSLVLQACHSRHIAVTSFSGGTSFGGALTSLHGGICISFENMKSIIALHEDDQDVVVQPGLNWMDLNEQIKDTGLFSPVDPAPGACIGGMIAMSCSGTNAYRYGTMKEWVISLTVVLADGKIVKTHGRPRKSAAGYDLTHLVVGSEGTLGLVTEAVLRLATLPQNLFVGVATFETFAEGVDIVVQLQKQGHKLEALELADGPQMHCLNHSKLCEQCFEEKPTLFFKIAGPSKQLVHDQVAILEKLCKERNALSVEITEQPERVNAIWSARKSMGMALLSMKQKETDLFIHSDCAVPISNLAKLVEGTQDLIRTAAARDNKTWFCANVGHIGDGNVHSSIVCPQEDKEAAEAVLREIARLALSLEGTITGEHGVGTKLRDALEEEVGTAGIEVMRAIKLSVDPRGILNPDKVFRLESQGEYVGQGRARL